MSNPVEILVALFESWQVPANTTVEARRRTVGQVDQDIEFWRQQAEAVRLVRQVDQLVDDLESAGQDIDFIQESRVWWYRACLGVDTGWSTPNADHATEALNRIELRFLRALAVAVKQAGLVDEISGTDIGAMRTAVVELEDVVRALDDLDGTSKLTMLGVLAEFRRCLDSYETVGVVSVREAAQRTLSVVVVCDRAHANPQQRGRLAAIFDSIAGGAFGGAGAVGVIAAVSMGTQLLGGG